jgi:dipeptidyl aminopeptidase/acylaminoacyl peptidase
MRARWSATILVLLALGVSRLFAQVQVQATSGYSLPPKVIVDILDAPPLPTAAVSPSYQVVALIQRASMPAIAELAQPMYRLAGMRINPRTNGLHRSHQVRSIVLKSVAVGAEIQVPTPPSSRLAWIGFSPDGRRFAFTNARETGIELWIGEAATGQAKAVGVADLNAVWGDPCEWLNDSAALLCMFTAPNRGSAPAAPDVPTGPNIQENLGRRTPVHTYEDMLTSAHDEALLEYFGTSELAIVDAATGVRSPVGRPGLYEIATASPSGEYLLVSRLKRPFSRLVPAENFPKEVEVWTRRGDIVKRIADLPVADNVPNNGVPIGPREYTWHTAAPATLVWAEALDEGDPKNTVPFRDRLMTSSAPFGAQPTELLKTEYRFQRIRWTDKGIALLNEYDRGRRRTRTWIVDAPNAQPRKLWDLSAEDRYNDPGAPTPRLGGAHAALIQQGDFIFTTSDGASPQGDRPFLARINVKTGASEQVFRSGTSSYESVVALLSDDGGTFVTRRESATDPPNYMVHYGADTTGGPTALTSYADATPQLRGISKQLLTYKRNDGVQLSATLYLPPNYKKGERLPLVVWAYPREFTDPNTAGQVVGSPNRFTIVTGPSHLLFLTQGYAVLDNPTMPIVGPGETANDTYIEQLVASAQAAVDTVVDMGVADRDRCVIGGHSYGAFMTANLLAHSDIFRAGIARSGAYNRTLTPFGFQNESRTFWEATNVYTRISPFWYADKIKEPVLLIHGEADDNSGTFPIQSERFYMALKGHGATVRYVTLPHEAHSYAARESVLHTVTEMLSWADKYAKNAGPRTPTSADAR